MFARHRGGRTRNGRPPAPHPALTQHRNNQCSREDCARVSQNVCSRQTPPLLASERAAQSVYNERREIPSPPNRTRERRWGFSGEEKNWGSLFGVELARRAREEPLSRRQSAIRDQSARARWIVARARSYGVCAKPLMGCLFFLLGFRLCVSELADALQARKPRTSLNLEESVECGSLQTYSLVSFPK